MDRHTGAPVANLRRGTVRQGKGRQGPERKASTLAERIDRRTVRSLRRGIIGQQFFCLLVTLAMGTTGVCDTSSSRAGRLSYPVRRVCECSVCT